MSHHEAGKDNIGGKLCSRTFDVIASRMLTVCSSIIAVLGFALSLYVVFSNQRQKRIDNLLTLHQFLHRDELSESRRYVRESEVKLSLKDPNVRRVCSSFDLAGTLVRHGAVNKELFLDYWCAPLLDLEQSLYSLANEQTGRTLKVKEYYKDFWWLIEEARLQRHDEQSR
ncbi:MAG: hypothetical protein ACK5TH_16880 [Prosthecobacter sp.]